MRKLNTMAHIIIQEEANRKVRIDIEGEEKVLASIIASAIINDPHFGIRAVGTCCNRRRANQIP